MNTANLFSFIPDSYFLIALVVIFSGFLRGFIGFGSGFAFTLTKNNERVLDLFSDAVINPLLTEEEFEKEKDKLTCFFS